MEKLLDIDPLNPFNYWLAAWVHLMAGRVDLAIEPVQKVHKMDPIGMFRTTHALMLAHARRVDEAASLLDVEYDEPVTDEWAALGIVLKYALEGNKEKTLASVTEELARDAKTDMLYSWLLAEFISLVDEKDQALDWLEIAAAGGFINYPFLSEFDPLLDNIRREKRFKQLMEKVKYEWEHLEV